MSLFATLRLVSRSPRFRSPERDRETDLARVGGITGQVGTALAAIDAEIEGLSNRHRQAVERACGLMGTADAMEYGRDEADEKELVEAEAQIKRAEARLRDLKAQREALVAVDAMLAGVIPAHATSAAA